MKRKACKGFESCKSAYASHVNCSLLKTPNLQIFLMYISLIYLTYITNHIPVSLLLFLYNFGTAALYKPSDAIKYVYKSMLFMETSVLLVTF